MDRLSFAAFRMFARSPRRLSESRREKIVVTNLALVFGIVYAPKSDEVPMQSSKHLAALVLVGVVGVFMAAGSKKPITHVSPLPPVDRREAAVATVNILSAADTCMQLKAGNLNMVDPVSYQAMREACLRAAEDEARNLEFRDNDFDVVHPGTDEATPTKRTPRVARRNALGGDDTTDRRNR